MAMTDAQLRARVRELMASGDLPSERPVTYGTGAEVLGSRSDSRRRPPDTWLICAEPGPSFGYFWTGGRMASLDAACGAVWTQEQSDTGT